MWQLNKFRQVLLQGLRFTNNTVCLNLLPIRYIIVAYITRLDSRLDEWSTLGIKKKLNKFENNLTETQWSY